MWRDFLTGTGIALFLGLLLIVGAFTAGMARNIRRRRDERRNTRARQTRQNLRAHHYIRHANREGTNHED